MKKLLFLGSTVASFLNPIKTWAAVTGDDINIGRPTDANGNPIGYSDLGKFINNLITLAFIFAILFVLIMLVWGAFEWIVSGGDKEAVGKARGRILNAMIGLAVLAVAFALAKVGGQFLGFDITSSIRIPTP